MGYFDKYLMHEDGRDKGMNSTSSEKGTDGKKNNTSEYNHQYYMKNKEKWRDNKSSVGASYHEFDENDPDYLAKNYSDKDELIDGYFGKQRPDGSWVIVEEDMKWTVPPGVDRETIISAIKDAESRSYKSNAEFVKAVTDSLTKHMNSKSGGEKEFDVDAAARDVIRGKYGNGADRKKALGDDYAAVQQRVNEMLGAKTSSKSTSSTPAQNQAKTESSTSSNKPRSREKNVTGEGTGLYKRGEGLNEQEKKKDYKFLNRRSSGISHHFQDNSDHLEHHGILGQKWGVRRFEKAGGGLTSAGKKRYNTDENGNYKKVGKDSSKSGSSDSGQKKGLSDKQKKALKIGAAVTATTLATYGVYKVSQINKKPKAFTTEQLKSMGISVFEPERIEINRIQLNRTPVNITSSKPIKTVVPSASSVNNANEKLQATLNQMKSMTSSNAAASGQNDFVYDLLKKNSATLSSLGF